MIYISHTCKVFHKEFNAKRVEFKSTFILQKLVTVTLYSKTSIYLFKWLYYVLALFDHLLLCVQDEWVFIVEIYFAYKS